MYHKEHDNGLLVHRKYTVTINLPTCMLFPLCCAMSNRFWNFFLQSSAKLYPGNMVQRNRHNMYRQLFIIIARYIFFENNVPPIVLQIKCALIVSQKKVTFVLLLTQMKRTVSRYPGIFDRYEKTNANLYSIVISVSAQVTNHRCALYIKAQ